MSADGALLLALDALHRETKAAAAERTALKASGADIQRDALYERARAKDKERDVKERDALLAEIRAERELVREAMREREALRKRVPDLERHLFESARQTQQLEARLGRQAQELTATFEARITRARTVALDELEAHAKRMYALLPPDASVELTELVDAMRLVVAKNVI